ncbi:MAG TPA: KpsF/GutQ family sugar-phosphate isomerase [Vicinamibacterales bacterium]|nr:KpsF/GutQ family sugar-phosphate isomerase [Vicinamibacterales bacterium]HPW20923.1 KpsF/GutQ family sugar-phosphate isomerase [Vicinamibacterales bacterium]
MIDLDVGRRVLRTEAAAVLGLVDRVDGRFAAAVALLAGCRGRVIVTGMGKSGIIARKVAATLSSTGTAAFFLHPAEAVHGDLGAVQGDDVVVALSHTGETGELLRLLETIKRIGARLVALTGRADSTLARAADVVLDCGVDEEACPLNLAPTASTTAALAMGDALAMTLLVEKGFQEEDFANLHPGGGLGKRLLRAEALMHTGAEMPVVGVATPIRAAVAEMSAKGLGMTCVVGGDGRLAGVITDGDLRRHMDLPGLLDQPASAVMTAGPKTIERSLLAVQALALMEQRKITSLIVVDADRRIEGVLHLHDLWRTQMF